MNIASETASSGAPLNRILLVKVNDVKCKGTQKYKELYVDIHDIETWLIPINGLHAHRWFIDDTWFESLGNEFTVSSELM